MKKLALAITMLMTSCMGAPVPAADVPAKPNKDGSVTFTLTKEQWEHCQANGGCITAPVEWIKNGVFEAARKMCGVGT